MVFGQVRVSFYNGSFHSIFDLPSLNSVTNSFLDNRILPTVGSRSIPHPAWIVCLSNTLSVTFENFS